MNNLEYIIQIKPDTLKYIETTFTKYGTIIKQTKIGTTFASILINLHSTEDLTIIENMENVITISKNMTINICNN